MSSHADRVLPGRIVVVAPHMDDELIGCGSILASLADASRAHVIYASDGSLSPSSPYPWRRVDRSALARTREQEARAGLRALGLPAEHAHFLGLLDGSLRHRREQLEERLDERITALAPDHLLVPFRMDCHPDHLAVAAAVHSLRDRGRVQAAVYEYFAYARWKLLRGGDVRGHLREDLLLRFEPSAEAAARKRAAFEAHASQTSLYYPWQKRANLTPAFVDAHFDQPEILLRNEPGAPLDAVFRGDTKWIHVVHAVEPRLKRSKDLVMDLLRG